VNEPAIVVELGRGRSGELVLLRRGEELQVVCNGAFVIASCNEQSSRALVAAARPSLPAGPLDVLIGGLGMGYALDEALDLPGLHSVTVAEYEPLIVEWFTTHMRERASRAERDARSRIVVTDVHDLLHAGSRYDLIALDTDNGPQWPIKADNARLYEAGGLRLIAGALRPEGVVVFWSPERYEEFEAALHDSFGRVAAQPATDVVDGRSVDYTMFVCCEPRPNKPRPNKPHPDKPRPDGRRPAGGSDARRVAGE
jgi:spermidine synthase